MIKDLFPQLLGNKEPKCKDLFLSQRRQRGLIYSYAHTHQRIPLENQDRGPPEKCRDSCIHDVCNTKFMIKNYEVKILGSLGKKVFLPPDLRNP